MRLGVDDTDSPDGGCTTHVLTDLVALGRSHGLDVLGEPRLVRLNPNVPWKTRGNAALSVSLGHGSGPSVLLGEIEGEPVPGFSRGRPPSGAEARAFREAAWALVQDRSRNASDADPALVVTERPLPSTLYTRAVESVVAPADVVRSLRAYGAWFRSARSRRGLVGAAAAAAWPGRRKTWELIAYREPGATGPRRVDAASVRRARRREPTLFLCDDPATRRILVAPHTHCPILFGLRATSPDGARRARPWIRSEPVDRWLLFRTNQGTGDHVRARTTLPLVPFTPARLRGTIEGPVEVLRGGHARAVLSVGGAPVECRAFEPTKVLPRVVAALRPGDLVEVWGGTARDPTLRLEGVQVLRLERSTDAVRGPRCLTCDRASKSLGLHRGYRCPGCHRRWPPEAGQRLAVERRLRLGTYHPTPSARRHLAPRGPEGHGTGSPP